MAPDDHRTAHNSLDSGFAEAACAFDFYVELEWKRMLVRQSRALARSMRMREAVQRIIREQIDSLPPE